jgi:hypothetical protein
VDARDPVGRVCGHIRDATFSEEANFKRAYLKGAGGILFFLFGLGLRNRFRMR